METSRIGFVGLGRMGLPMAKLLATHGVVVGFDSNTTAMQTAISTARSEDLTLVNSLIELIADLPAPRVIWLMVPARLLAALVNPLSTR
jgi:6-phosphogluconate dehydrogenase